MNHPITPPPELVQQWREASSTGELHFSPQYLAVQAARWGADQELEACCDWLIEHGYDITSPKIRTARRKPPTLKEQALEALKDIECEYVIGATTSTIRRALKALPE
jgi:hypothetical protein